MVGCYSPESIFAEIVVVATLKLFLRLRSVRLDLVFFYFVYFIFKNNCSHT